MSASQKYHHYGVDAHSAQRILLALVALGRPFQCDPLPESEWQISVKAEDADAVRPQIARRAPVYFEDGQFRSQKYPAAEALWSAICDQDVAAAAEIIRTRGDVIGRVGNGIMLLKAADTENVAMTRLLLETGALPRPWWSEDAVDFIRNVTQGDSPKESM